MKIKKYAVLLAFSAGFFIAVPVLAASSDFKDKAQIYYQNNCNKTRVSRDKAILCYLFDKTSELEAQVVTATGEITTLRLALNANTQNDTALTGRVNTLESDQEKNTQGDNSLASRVSTLESSAAPSSKALRLFDAKGTELGIVMSYGSQDHFFYEPLQRLIRIDASNGRFGTDISPIYATSDCTGVAYGDHRIDGETSSGNNMVNVLLSDGYGAYFTYKRGDASISISPIWMRVTNDGGKTFTCANQGTRVNPSTPLTPVTIPFPNPLPLPLEYRYQ